MSRFEFHDQVLKMVCDVVVGWKCNFQISTTASADQDELFLCLGVQRGHGIVKRVAHSEGYYNYFLILRF